MSASAKVEILVIGNELLIGEIQDTNSSWLCREITARGGEVSRVTMVRDVEEVVAAEVAAALARGVDLLLTSGGLGPTADDLTLAAVARGAGVPLVLNQEALAQVRRRYDELAAAGILSQGGLNQPREKMAWLPEGAQPLFNSAGTAPAVLLRAGGTSIVSLPGVPFELKAIFHSTLRPLLDETFVAGQSQQRALLVECNDESLMEPVLTRVVREHPRVYLKSLATPVEETRELEVKLVATGADPAQLTADLDAAQAALEAGLTLLGFQHRRPQVKPSP